MDDLRPELGCYGASPARSPSIDAFARSARIFLRHYVQVPTCGASRFALLTSLHPTTDRPASLGNGAFRLLDREESPRVGSLPELFRRAGYTTVSIGKVSHQPDGRRRAKEGGGDGPGDPEVPHAWDEVYAPTGRWGDAWSAFFGYADGTGRERGKSPPLETADVDDDGYPDGLIAREASRRLAELARGDAPFFLAVGFYKPHLPFNAPRRYVDAWRPEDVPGSPAPAPPADVDPRVSLHASGELLGNYGGHPEAPAGAPRVDAAYAARLRRAYLACVSYVDAQVGRVLRALEESGLDDRTIVVLWGDHGWHLGDLDVWGKHTLHEWSLRSPLIVRAPGMTRPGAATEGIVESVDIYPTLAELCALEPPADLDGRSFARQLRDPGAEGKEGALGRFARGGRRGVTVRDARWRWVRWERGDGEHQDELYDHASDPHETRNVAASHPEVVRELSARVER